MIPLRDNLPSRSWPLVTVALIACNIGVFLYQMSLGGERGQQLVVAFGAIPALVTGQARAAFPIPPVLTVLTAMFLHGGLLHLAGNMLYLWIFGDNVEDVMGKPRFLLFYLLSGYAAAFLHIVMFPASRVPMVGASGAISGVLGAYLILFPRASVLTLVPLGFVMETVRIPAFVFLLFWFVLQFLYVGASAGQGGGGVAWLAHVGGFVAGMVLVFLFRKRERLAWYRRLV